MFLTVPRLFQDAYVDNYRATCNLAHQRALQTLVDEPEVQDPDLVHLPDGQLQQGDGARENTYF